MLLLLTDEVPGVVTDTISFPVLTLSTISIIRVTLNTDFDNLWFSGVFANTIALTPTLCILVTTSGLFWCYYVPFSLLGLSSFLLEQAKVWCFR